MIMYSFASNTLYLLGHIKAKMHCHIAGFGLEMGMERGHWTRSEGVPDYPFGLFYLAFIVAPSLCCCLQVSFCVLQNLCDINSNFNSVFTFDLLETWLPLVCWLPSLWLLNFAGKPSISLTWVSSQ